MTYIENLGAFLTVTGPEHGHIAHFLANVDWPSDAHRDEFIGALQAPAPAGP